MAKPAKSKALCRGCYNDVYNNGCGGAQECWSYKDAEVRRRMSVYYMDPMDRAKPCWALSCYRQVNGMFFFDTEDARAP